MVRCYEAHFFCSLLKIKDKCNLRVGPISPASLDLVFINQWIRNWTLQRNSKINRFRFSQYFILTCPPNGLVHGNLLPESQ